MSKISLGEIMPIIMNCPICDYKTIFKHFVYCPRCGNGLCKIIVRRKSDVRYQELVKKKEKL